MAIESKKVRISPRQRTKFRIRKKVSGSPERPRMSIYRSSQHTYAQIISDVTGQTLASASTLDKAVQEKAKSLAAEQLPAGNNGTRSPKSVAAAVAVGLILAERAVSKNVSAAVFDRNGFVYFGRVKAVADGARAGGLKF